MQWPADVCTASMAQGQGVIQTLLPVTPPAGPETWCELIVAAQKYSLLGFKWSDPAPEVKVVLDVSGPLRQKGQLEW